MSKKIVVIETKTDEETDAILKWVPTNEIEVVVENTTQTEEDYDEEKDDSSS